MIIPCKHSSDFGGTSASHCDLGLHGGHPSFGVCLRVCDKYVGPDRAPLIAQLEAKHAKAQAAAVRRFKPGAILRHIIHFLLDCIEVLPFVRPRARHKLCWVDRVKTCGVCVEHEIQIDYYCLHLWNTLRRRFVTEAT